MKIYNFKYIYEIEIKFRKWIVVIWMLLMFIFVMVFFVRVVGEVIVWNCNIIGLFIWFLYFVINDRL